MAVMLSSFGLVRSVPASCNKSSIFARASNTQSNSRRSCKKVLIRHAGKIGIQGAWSVVSVKHMKSPAASHLV